MRVLISTNIPSPYRWKFWNQLSEKNDLTVIFDSKIAKDRNKSWYSSDKAKFKEIYLNGFQYNEEFKLSLGAVRHFLSNNYDIRIVGGYSSFSYILTLIALKITGKKYILEMDGAVSQRTGKLKKAIKGFLINGAALYLSPGQSTDDYLVDYGVERSLIRRYHFSSLADADIRSATHIKKEKKQFRQKLGIGENKVLISVGQFIHRKGFDVLLKALVGLPDDVGCYIVGGKPTEEYLQIISENGLKNVHFIDHISKEELFDYYRAADCFVFPTRYDIWGLVVNEAMANGLPVITTDMCVAGMELVNDGENGYIVPVDNVEQMHQRIVEVLSDDTVLESMSRESLLKIRLYTIENMAREYDAVFEELKTKKD